jgi:REP element-mobilizing transposase RayT
MPILHKNIRLQPLQYMGQSSYFVTLCCALRRPVFGDSKKAEWLVDILRKHSLKHGFAVHAYCVMPDHFHALVSGLGPASSLLPFIKNLKQTTRANIESSFGRRSGRRTFTTTSLGRKTASPALPDISG